MSGLIADANYSHGWLDHRPRPHPVDVDEPECRDCHPIIGMTPEPVPVEDLHPCGMTGPDHRHLTRVDALRCSRDRRA